MRSKLERIQSYSGLFKRDAIICIFNLKSAQPLLEVIKQQVFLPGLQSVLSVQYSEYLLFRNDNCSTTEVFQPPDHLHPSCHACRSDQVPLLIFNKTSVLTKYHTFVCHRIQKLEEEMEGIEKNAKIKRGRKKEENLKNIERPKSLIQDMSDPFEDFPHTEPFDCINITQRSSNLIY